jgi:hypothetical protein
VDWVNSGLNGSSGNLWKYGRGRDGGRVGDMHNSYWILDIGFFFVQTIERSIGRRVNGDLTSVGYTFDSRSSNDVYFTID